MALYYNVYSPLALDHHQETAYYVTKIFVLLYLTYIDLTAQDIAISKIYLKYMKFHLDFKLQPSIDQAFVITQG